MIKILKSYLVKLCIAIISVLFISLVAEGVLRMMAHSRWALFVSPTRVQAANKAGEAYPRVKSMRGGIYWEPDIVVKDDEETNKNFIPDFRNRFFDKSVVSKQKRIVLLGDSIGYGFGGRENLWEIFSAIIEELLNKTQPEGPGFAVANFSWGSYSPFQEAIAFERHGMKFSPHLVILEFTRNDFTNFVYSNRHPQYTTRKGTYVLTIGEDVLPMSLPIPLELNKLLSEYSMLFRYLNLRVDALRTKWNIKKYTVEYSLTRKKALEAIDRIHSLARANSSNLLIVLFPVTDKPFARHSSKEYPYSEVVAFARKKGIPVFDLIADMRDVDYKAVRIDTAGHLNKSGHRIVAEKIFNYLQEYPELLNSRPKPIK
ncbi:MAG: SGNH/GDSL hydrolase family protein [bacterium]